MDLNITQLIHSFTEERRFIKGVSAATLQWYRYSFNAFAPFITPCQTEPQLREALKTAVITMASKGQNPISINDRIRCVNAWLNWLHLEGKASQRIRLQFLSEPQKITPTLTQEEIVKLVKCHPRTFHERRVHAMACLILDCGPRVGEVLDLVVADIDSANLLLTIREGKGRRGRVVPISPEAHRRLWPWLRGKHASDYVFGTQAGGELDQSAALKHLKKLLRKLNLAGSRVAWHALRHTFAVMYIRAGGSVFHLQRILGHASLDMTRRYVNLQTADLQSVHSKLSSLARLS
jgi:integrase/recombinase XerD